MHTTRTPEVDAIVRISFPQYRGRTYKIEPFRPMKVTSCWDGGSRYNYCFVGFNGKTAAVPENGTPFTEEIKEVNELPENVVLVKHTIYCGKDLGITIYVNEKNLTPLLPAPVNLTWDEKVVLSSIKGFKSCYGGTTNYRFHVANRYTGISGNDYDAAKAKLVARGFINTKGSITIEGRNAIGDADLYRLEKKDEN